jgi:hypothetical protein
VYWSIFDSLPKNLRPAFKEMWGRLFELYAVDLLGAFYPPFWRMLTADLNYDAGQVDAMLDFWAGGGGFRDRPARRCHLDKRLRIALVVAHEFQIEIGDEIRHRAATLGSFRQERRLDIQALRQKEQRPVPCRTPRAEAARRRSVFAAS